jgi:hypothetical protein
MLTNFFESVEEKYSKYLLEFIKRMLVSNQSTRPNFRDLSNMITPQKSDGTAVIVKDEELKFSSITDLNNRDPRKISNSNYDSRYNEKIINSKLNIENI